MRVVATMYDVCGEVIVLQQPWLWFAGVQGIEAQHCMDSWSGVIAAMQSANCRNNNAPAARTTNSLLPIMFPTNSSGIGRSSQGFGANENCV
jgi:hypothetical protein